MGRAASNKEGHMANQADIDKVTKKLTTDRAAFVAHGEGWRPESAKGKELRQAVRDGRKALKALTGATTATAAYTAVGHTPTYAPRGKSAQS